MVDPAVKDKVRKELGDRAIDSGEAGEQRNRKTSDDVPMNLRRPVMDIEGWSPENAIKVGS
ncbi:hypothetical protein ACS0TY_024460 [Phlomoides rotata]